jgi:tRNA-dihydrouridine synthase
MRGLTKSFFIRILRQLNTLPDVVVSEFLRVHPTSTIDHDLQILLKESQQSTYKLHIQLLGNDISSIVRTIHQLEDQYAFDGINLNFACPMPKIYRKDVGGALLRDIHHLEPILAAARETTTRTLSVKIRIGFHDDHLFSKTLELINRHHVDMLFLHARTVQGRYSVPVEHSYTAQAVSQTTCPVFANGDIQNAEQARKIQTMSSCSGVMIGRAAIRYPWIFREMAQKESSTRIHSAVTFGHVLHYIMLLWEALRQQLPEVPAIHALKAFLNFVALGIDAHGQFLYRAQRICSFQDLQQLCSYLEERSIQIFQPTPFSGLYARPNREKPPHSNAIDGKSIHG